MRLKLHQVGYIQPSPLGYPTLVLAVARHGPTRRTTHPSSLPNTNTTSKLRGIHGAQQQSHNTHKGFTRRGNARTPPSNPVQLTSRYLHAHLRRGLETSIEEITKVAHGVETMASRTTNGTLAVIQSSRTKEIKIPCNALASTCGDQMLDTY